MWHFGIYRWSGRLRFHPLSGRIIYKRQRKSSCSRGARPCGRRDRATEAVVLERNLVLRPGFRSRGCERDLTHPDGHARRVRKVSYADGLSVRSGSIPTCAARNFAGLYVGGSVGYATAGTDSTFLDDSVPSNFVSSGDHSGALYGVHVGYNYQQCMMVLGIEGDWTWMQGSAKRINDQNLASEGDADIARAS